MNFELKKKDETPLLEKILPIFDRVKEVKEWLIQKGDFLITTGTGTLSAIIGQESTITILFSIIPLCYEGVKRVRVENNIKDVVLKLNEELPQLNQDFLQSQDGKELLETSFIQMMKCPEDMINMYQKFLLDSSKKPDSEKFRIRSNAKILFSLEPEHVFVLKKLWFSEELVDKVLQHCYNNSEDNNRYSVRMLNDVGKVLNFEDDVFREIIGHLANCGLAENRFNTGTSWNKEDILSDKGKTKTLAQIKSGVTLKGEKFIKQYLE